MANDQKNDEKKDQGRIKNYLRGVKAERKKIIWPGRDEVIKYTSVVIALSIAVSLFVFCFDLLFNSAITKLISL